MPETRTKKLDHTGIAALTTAYVSYTRDNFRDFTPSLAALAEEFFKFKILELKQLNSSNTIIPPQNQFYKNIPSTITGVKLKPNGEIDVSHLETEKNNDQNLLSITFYK